MSPATPITAILLPTQKCSRRPRSPAGGVVRADLDRPVSNVADREARAQRRAADGLRVGAGAVTAGDRDLVLVRWTVAGRGRAPARHKQARCGPVSNDVG